MKTFVTAALVSILATSAAFGAGHSVRLGTEGAYPPYNFINDAGEVDGFEREVGDRLCELAALDCSWVTNDWDSIIPNLVSGNYDVIIAGMSITDERDEVIDFTQEYMPADPSIYVALAGADGPGETISAQTNTIQAGYVAAAEGMTLVEFANPDETVAAVRSGEADSVLAEKAYLDPLIEESGGELAMVGDFVFIGGGIGIGVRESDTELKDKLNAAIDTMKADGTLNALIEKWFPGHVGY